MFSRSYAWKNPHVVRLMRHRSRHHPNLLQVRVKMFITFGISTCDWYKLQVKLRGGFKCVSFSLLFGTIIQFWLTFLEMGLKPPTRKSSRLDLFELVFVQVHCSGGTWSWKFDKGLTSESRTINYETLRNGGVIPPPAPLDVPCLVCIFY